MLRRPRAPGRTSSSSRPRAPDRLGDGLAPHFPSAESVTMQVLGPWPGRFVVHLKWSTPPGPRSVTVPSLTCGCSPAGTAGRTTGRGGLPDLSRDASFFGGVYRISNEQAGLA